MEQTANNDKNRISITKYLEVIGLSFLLFAFGWETFEKKTEEISNGGEWYIINEKLDQVWGAEKAICETVKCDQFEGSIYINFNSWPKWTQLEDVKKQHEIFQKIRILIFILGSLLVIGGKYSEIKEEKKLQLYVRALRGVPAEGVAENAGGGCSEGEASPT